MDDHARRLAFHARKANMEWQAFVYLLKEVTFRALAFGHETWQMWKKVKFAMDTQTKSPIADFTTRVELAQLPSGEEECAICL